jgi:putative ABC transport system permease protein
MFSIDQWREIYLSIKQHKLRTFLTGFGVFWGIFLLLLLMGTGNGLERGVSQQFAGQAINSFFTWGGKTSLPYQGMNPGRRITLTNADLKAIRENIHGVENLNASIFLEGEFAINYKKNSGSFTVIGNLPDLRVIESVTIDSGRFINSMDCDKKRKVAIIGRKAKEILFATNRPIGEYIRIKGVYFKVVGVFNRIENSDSGRDPTACIYIPLSSLQQTFKVENKIHYIGARVSDELHAPDIERKTVALLKKRHRVSPEDRRGIGSWNSVEKFITVRNLFKGIKIFVWIVGIGTLTAGIVGVSNIMLIIVGEKTREIGIRKAVGATPFSIIKLILQESVIITFISGYIGLVAGVFTLESIGYVMEKFHLQNRFFQNPEINLTVAGYALILIVMTGLFAGLMPAYRAACINPIEALRNN